MNAKELQDWLMQQYGAEKFRPGLERVAAFLSDELAAVKKLNPKIVTIAGTNGKGETALSLAQIARQEGKSYVLWTSPHIHSVCERFQNQDGAISEPALTELILAGEKIRALKKVGLSYYEALWCAFLRWGLSQKAEVWILEVGLGGRLDAVNLVDAQVVALTSISRDHQEFLGHRYQQILYEKLGVLRLNCTLISALESQYLRSLCAEKVKDLMVTWKDLFATQQLSSKASFSERNRGLAQEIWLALYQQQVNLRSEPLLARGEVIHWRGHEFTFYGSHNPDGVRKLVQFLQSSSYNLERKFFHQVWGAFSQRPDPDLRAMVKMLAGLEKCGASVFITRFEHLKAAVPTEWWGEQSGAKVKYIHEWNELKQSLASQSHQRILVVGSYYFVAQVQHSLLHS